ncbi:hypothetical protein K490DRAFT_50295 [Saccharata proteae CBS 121410]|uniref:Uncharacterized protein n=1 Tax=Saccharata proteae CBS 121410 TaxID=1314787 RepID=A0A9P4HLT8_9PEZI|nr:hypothetical protein K490DRAFT_50295 [Saccharata proteae CBS 121410]
MDVEEADYTPVDPSAQYLHLVIPASDPDVNLCKTMLTAAVCGFPTPNIINWNETFDNPNLVAGGSHIAKITGVLEFLRSLPAESDSDLVLLVDGYDIWFQVAPSVIIERYHRINKEANARIRARLGPAAELEGIKQTILFSAQKRCWPWSDADTPCFAVPQSSLPEDVYGPETDTDIGNRKNPYIKFRQRFLCSGDAMGPVRDMRALFERAKVLMEHDSNFGSDQKIFSQILGEQSFQREVSIIDSHPPNRLMKHYSGTPLEFSLGLDYASLIGHPTVFAEEDSAWLHYNDTMDLEDAVKALEVGSPKVNDLPSDIESSRPPFQMIKGEGLPTELGWKDVPLYTNLWTGVVPGIIHHNAHRDGLKSLRQTWWNETWMFPYARQLLQAQVQEPVSPVAVLGNETWWSPIEQRGGAKTDKGDWLAWGDVCEGMEDELFRDDQGPWVDPRVFPV